MGVSPTKDKSAEITSPPTIKFSNSSPILKSRSGDGERGAGRGASIASRRMKVRISQLDTVELPGLQSPSPGGEIASPFSRFPAAERPKTSEKRDRVQLSVRISPKVRLIDTIY